MAEHTALLGQRRETPQSIPNSGAHSHATVLRPELEFALRDWKLNSVVLRQILAKKIGKQSARLKVVHLCKCEKYCSRTGGRPNKQNKTAFQTKPRIRLDRFGCCCDLVGVFDAKHHWQQATNKSGAPNGG